MKKMLAVSFVLGVFAVNAEAQTRYPRPIPGPRPTPRTVLLSPGQSMMVGDTNVLCRRSPIRPLPQPIPRPGAKECSITRNSIGNFDVKIGSLLVATYGYYDSARSKVRDLERDGQCEFSIYGPSRLCTIERNSIGNYNVEIDGMLVISYGYYDSARDKAEELARAGDCTLE